MTLAERPLGELARDLPGATRVFHAHDLDFCCAGRQRLDEAAAARGLDVAAIVRELEALPPAAQGEVDWRGSGTTTLIGHLLSRYHEVHRQQLPELIRLARRVEQVHGERDSCPNGLADALTAMQQELESHMQKEEQVLFPMLSRQAAGVDMPISVMRFEHEQHGEALGRLLALAHGFVPPPGACTTWRALYAGIQKFAEDLTEHVHLENNVLFPRFA
jgi:regulator of cell morphogenesis and NO signaling